MTEPQSTRNNRPPPLKEVVSEEEWSGWVGHPITQIFRALMRKRLEDTKQNWADGKLTHPSAEGTAMLSASAIGGCKVLNELLNLTADDINSEMRNDDD